MERSFATTWVLLSMTRWLCFPFLVAARWTLVRRRCESSGVLELAFRQRELLMEHYV